MESEEALREAACIGNLRAVKKLIGSGTSVNSQNSMNGWTALHWACKRGHASIAQVLLQNGADISIKTFKGELASELTTSTEVLATMKIEPDEDFARRCSEGMSKLPIVPNYLRSAVFPYATPDDDLDTTLSTSSATSAAACNDQQCSRDRLECKSGEDAGHKPSDDGKNLATESTNSASSPAVFRVRVSGRNDSDFVEVEVPSLSYPSLLKACCEELEVAPYEITKIRKLPNVWVRKDKDVQRLKSGQELEIILSTE